MKNRKTLVLILSLAILVPAFLYVSGILAQFMININQWKAAGSNYHQSPGLPSLQVGAIVRALVTFPEGLEAIGVIAVGVAVLCIYGLRLGWGTRGITDPYRNLTISNDGSYGTAAFMARKEAEKDFEVVSVNRTDQDILGMFDDDKVITLGKDTRLNHNIAICGAPGTGKSRSISRNLILQSVRRGDSLVVTDPKSELFESMGPYLEKNGYTVRVFNLVDMDHSDSWNCLAEVGESELMAQTFAEVVLANTTGDQADAFWYNAEMNLLKALVLYVAEMPPDQRNLGTVYDLLCETDSDALKSRMENAGKSVINPYTGEVIKMNPCWPPYQLFCQASPTVQSSVIIGLGSKLQMMQAQQVRNVTSHTEIDLELPGKQKCAYFCIVSDQDSTFDFLSSLFFSFLFIRLVRYADAYCPEGMLPTKVKFVLDEFPNCCLIPDFTKKCSTVRSRGLELAIFFQNVGQMKNRYPDDQWQEILGSCDTTIFLGCNDILTAKYFSDRSGVSSVEVEGEMRTLNSLQITNYTPQYRKSNSLGRRQLLTPDEVLRLQPDHELIFIRGRNVLQAKRFDYSRHPEYRKLRSAKANLHEPAWRMRFVKAGSDHPVQSERVDTESGQDTAQEKPTVPVVQGSVIAQPIDHTKLFGRSG